MHKEVTFGEISVANFDYRFSPEALLPLLELVLAKMPEFRPGSCRCVNYLPEINPKPIPPKINFIG